MIKNRDLWHNFAKSRPYFWSSRKSYQNGRCRKPKRLFFKMTVKFMTKNDYKNSSNNGYFDIKHRSFWNEITAIFAWLSFWCYIDGHFGLRLFWFSTSVILVAFLFTPYNFRLWYRPDVFERLGLVTIRSLWYLYLVRFDR